MIHVERGGPPAGFEERAVELAYRFTEARNRDSALTASKFWQRVRPELRADAAELAERFHHKCAFCEARMEHVQHPPVEHYRPKGRAEFEGFMFHWSNWLFSCGRCNESKWFCAVTRAFLSHEAPKLANPPQPHLRVSEEDGLNCVAQLVTERREETRRLV